MYEHPLGLCMAGMTHVGGSDVAVHDGHLNRLQPVIPTFEPLDQILSQDQAHRSVVQAAELH